MPVNSYQDTTTGRMEPQKGADGATLVSDLGILGGRSNRYIDGVDVVVPGPAVIATDLITLGSALDHQVGNAIILSGTDFTETTGLSLDGVQIVLTRDDSTHMTLDDGSGTVVDIDATGTAAGLAALVKRVTFTQGENVRRYRILAKALTGSGHIKWVEDAENYQQAGTWLLDPTSSETAEVMHMRAEDGVWTEWKELSKDESDASLSNLYFCGNNSAATWAIWLETE